jgi:hypothetical protein
MPNKKVVVEDSTPAPAIKPEMLKELKKEDMQQAVVERFKATPRFTTTATRGHSR